MRSNCSVAECFPEKWRRWNEQVCQGVKCKVLWTVPRTGYYIRTNSSLPIYNLCLSLQDQDVALPSEDRTGVFTEPSTVASSWYSEVLELRRRAEEYKRRAQGTHFLRSHLGQLYAKQAELWDTASSSSVVSALSLESPHTAV